MGLLDRLRNKPRVGEGGPERVPAHFAEQQAAAGAEKVTALAGRDMRSGDAVAAKAHTGLTPKVSGHTIRSEISSELPSTDRLSDFADLRTSGAAVAAGLASAASAVRVLPLIGHWPVPRQQRILGAQVVSGLLLLLLATVLALTAASRNTGQVGASGQALMQSQRLAKAVSQAMGGSPAAFGEIKEAAGVLAANTRALKQGGAGIAAAPDDAQALLKPLMPLIDRAEANAGVVMGQQKTLIQVGQALLSINKQAGELLESAEMVSALKLQQGAPASEVQQSGQLVMLTQRIGKSANEFLSRDGASAEAVLLLGKDLNTFRDIAEGLLNGNADLQGRKSLEFIHIVHGSIVA